MPEFGFAFLWTLIVSVATILVDFVAGRVVYNTYGVKSIRRLIDQATADESTISKIQTALDEVQRNSGASMAWGADIATLAFALDLAALGLWISDQTLFSLISRWNTEEPNVGLQVWLVIILVHFLLVLVTVSLRHVHAAKLGDQNVGSYRGTWMYLANILGFLTLLSSFLVLSS